MIPEFGQFGLMIALLCTVMQLGTAIYASLTHKALYWRLNQNAAITQILFVLFSFLCLLFAFISKDFSVAYVAQNANSHLPLFYRITGIWGAHEGSMLLWVTVLAVWTAVVMYGTPQLTTRERGVILSVLAAISFGFLLFILLTSDPFVRWLQHTPIEGQDLNPLLQDPGLATHPPTLYMGYVGFAVAFAFAVAALIEGKFTTRWIQQMRPFVLIAWCFLTLGITLGSWWSYRVLGWGGWWFWDPVENASFLPWLVGTALLHSIIVAQKRQTLITWVVLLAICSFSLSLMGTFLVRSGILVSVHTFAMDPARGKFILVFLLIVILSSLTLFAWRSQKLQATVPLQWLSRESFLLLNNLFFFIAMLTVLLGTIYPLITDALGLEKISVGAPYFNIVFIPLMLPCFFLMGIAPWLKWGRALHWRYYWRFFVMILGITLSTALLLSWLIQHRFYVWLMIGVGIAGWIMTHSVQVILTYRQQTKKYLGMVTAHIGVAITILGITFSSIGSIERDLRMQPGDSASIANYQFTFTGITIHPNQNYQGIIANFTLRDQAQRLTVLKPERRIFERDQMTVSKVAIKISLFHDLYIALGESMGDDAWAVRIYYKPCVRWIWMGGLLITLGGLLAWYERRKELD